MNLFYTAIKNTPRFGTWDENSDDWFRGYPDMFTVSSKAMVTVRVYVCVLVCVVCVVCVMCVCVVCVCAVCVWCSWCVTAQHNY